MAAPPSATLLPHYLRKTPGLICRYKEDGLALRPPALFTSVDQPMDSTSCPKSQLKSTYLTPKVGRLLDNAEMGKKKKKNTKCDHFFCPTSDFFNFCNPCFFYHTFTNDAYFVDIA